ncbi:AbrB/MazE/SpoVT family DNA-binding domain-containing protein (plasmid) [Haloplanus ruber]|uniref:AbrB/MazE/SpoVT family DNA-binding domain-containing protein n=1 Tax=Haloplanus ruber TaxID=869892 RepID=A0ABD6CSC5_9EURY|nr:AbrB/MazE/SpoVT family DNA-binding domain-containing protein [Haloplanus ruber]
MVKVDPNGRIILPQEIRDHLGLTPGTEVEIHKEDGKAVIEPADNPEEIIERMEELVEETSSEHGERSPLEDSTDPIAQKHRDAVRRGANNDG